jgi:hypothetical protein
MKTLKTHASSLLRILLLCGLLTPLNACMGIDDYEEVDEDPVYDWIKERY